MVSMQHPPAVETAHPPKQTTTAQFGNSFDLHQHAYMHTYKRSYIWPGC